MDAMFKKYDIIALSLIFSAIYWFIESFVHYFIFPVLHSDAITLDSSFYRELISPSTHELYMRITFMMLIIIFGLITQIILNKQRFLATHHELTKLPNSRSIFPYLEKYIRKNHHSEFTLLLCRPKKLKLINRIVGFDKGNDLISQLAKRLKEQFGTSLIGAWEEICFLFLLPGNQQQTLAKFQKQLDALLEQSFAVSDMPFHIEMDKAAVTFPETNTASKMIQKVYKALSRTNTTADGFCLYQSELDKEDIEYLSFMGELFDGIKRHEFKLYLQPQVTLLNEQIESYEVLIRWQHPQKGILLPGQFLEAAERCQAVNQLTKEIIKMTFSAISQLDIERSKRFSINLSAKNLLDIHLASFISKQLKQYAINPKNIVFEITETALMNNMAVAAKTLESLTKMGFQLSLDDFGTGYSSLAYLNQFNISEIKIDRVFITDVHKSHKKQLIVENIILLAKGIDANICAEGIEQKAELDFVKAKGCDLGQGFYWAKPQPINEVLKTHLT